MWCDPLPCTRRYQNRDLTSNRSQIGCGPPSCSYSRFYNEWGAKQLESTYLVPSFLLDNTYAYEYNINRDLIPSMGYWLCSQCTNTSWSSDYHKRIILHLQWKQSLTNLVNETLLVMEIPEKKNHIHILFAVSILFFRCRCFLFECRLYFFSSRLFTLLHEVGFTGLDQVALRKCGNFKTYHHSTNKAEKTTSQAFLGPILHQEHLKINHLCDTHTHTSSRHV